MHSRLTGPCPARRARDGTVAALILVAVATSSCSELPSEVENADPCTRAESIAVGQSRSGQLATGDCIHAQSGTFGDRWSLEISTPTTVRVELRSQVFDAFLELQDAHGAVLAWNDDTGGTDSRVTRQLAAGSYVILARSYAPGQSGQYQISVHDNAGCFGPSMGVGDTRSGTLQASDCPNEWNAPEDDYLFVLTQSQRLRLDLSSSAFDEVLLVRDAQGSIVQGSDWTHPVGHARIDIVLPAGTWTLSATVASPAATGAYELSATVAPACRPGTLLSLGNSVAGAITPDDCTIDGSLVADSFAISLTQETDIALHLKSSAFAPLLVVRDAQGAHVGFGIDTKNDGNARVRTTLAAGNYAVLVSGHPPSGAYTLALDAGTCPTPRSIAFGETSTGALDDTDCTRAGGAFMERWDLTLPTDTVLRIDLTSTEFDPFLTLRSGQGTILAQDDDGGSGLNSRIQIVLPAGTYRIEASSYGTGMIGTYTLGVGAPPSGAVEARPEISEGTVSKPPPFGAPVPVPPTVYGQSTPKAP